MGIADLFRSRNQTPALPGPGVPAEGGVVPAQHMDGGNQPPRLWSAMVRRADSIRNTMLGFGHNDKIAAGRPDPYAISLSLEELTTLYRDNGYASRFVDSVPNDATRKGWTVKDETGQIVERLVDEHDRLHLVERVHEADTWARLYGGAWIMLITDEDAYPGATSEAHQLSMPLQLDKVRRLLNLVVFDARECQAYDYVSDPADPAYRTPATYTINPNVGGVYTGAHRGVVSGARVHASRLVYFPGRKVPIRARWEQGGRDDSILRSVWPQIRDKTSSDHSMSLRALEAMVKVLKLRDTADMQLNDEATFFESRMRLLAESMGGLGVALLTEGEDYQQFGGTVSGMGELDQVLQRALQAVTGMPEQLWTGSAPGGLNSDGESHRNLWAQVISSYQTVKYQPRLVQIYDVMFSARMGPFSGADMSSWSVEFAPLDEMTEQGKASIRKTTAETDAIYVNMGALDPARVASARFGPDGWQQDIPAEDLATMTAEPFDMAAITAAMAGAGVDTSAMDEDPVESARLAQARALAEQMTAAGVERCEHGRPNRCPMCGVERVRKLVADPETGEAQLDETGATQWAKEWKATGDVPQPEPSVDPATGTPAEPIERPNGAQLQQAASVLGQVALGQIPAESAILLLGSVFGDEKARRMVEAIQTTPDEAALALAREAAAEGKLDRRSDNAGLGKIWVGIVLPDRALTLYESARLEAATVLGHRFEDFTPDGQVPHVTLFHYDGLPLGLTDAAAKMVGDVFDDALTDHDPLDLFFAYIDAFAPSPSSKGRTPVFLDVGGGAVYELNAAARAALLDDDEREQAKPFAAHATLGYHDAPITDEQWAKLRDRSQFHSGSFTATRIEMHVNGEMVRAWNLAEPEA